MSKKILNILDYYKEKARAYLGVIPSNINPNTLAEEYMWVNNINDIVHQKLAEYNAWYAGDGDKLLNLYTGNVLYNYNTEPLFDRNKRSYFWAVSATEDDIKRTHSGQPRNIIDTMVNIVGIPEVSCGDDKDTARLNKILSDNKFDVLYSQEHLPYELVEGWGAWKIDWDNKLRDTPILIYYRAAEVDFIYRDRQLLAIIYKNYYTDTENDRKYILFEVRRKERKFGVDNKWHSSLIIEKEVFELYADNSLVKRNLKDIPELADIEDRLIVNDYDGFLGGECIVFNSDDSTVYGRSVFTGKIDLFDDLDQDLSQAANTVRRSTTHVYINNNYLERNEKTGMPIMPSAYDCKYVMLNGVLGADGGPSGGSEPVMTVQPQINFSQYTSNAIDILVQIVSGYMSPATLGIDIAKKDNAEAQREKEKVTIFTRNGIIRRDGEGVRSICEELLMADELMNYGKITKHGYDVSVVYDEFGDNSFEAKTETLLTLYNAGVLPEDIFVKYLYKGMSDRDRDKIVEHIKQQKMDQGQAALTGMNPYNEAIAAQAAMENGSDVQAQEQVPDVVGTADNMRG